ncbi:inactive beta-amylase 9 [Dorcoceras hygrometricum]|uniref:Inactive beta-amylase 9 n=1 Tax=Dorcoceras hygrometricum TaxID=472368 RepID=A0A2Z7D7A5_9LAMI|nr:inactive beta-amylase 9 [Dorcoceras hygrometricum]
MHEIKLQPNTGSQRIPKAAQQLESEQKTVATMCVSIWEIPTRLSTRYQVHKQRSTCCSPTRDMWELPTPLTVANSPNREMRYGSYPLASTNTLARSIQQSKGTAIRDLKKHATDACMQCNTMQQGPSNADLTPAKPITNNYSRNETQKNNSWELRTRPTLFYPSISTESCEQHKTTQWRCLRTPHQLQANVRKQYPNKASQQEESNATTHTSIGAVYRWKSKKIRFGEQ